MNLTAASRRMSKTSVLGLAAVASVTLTQGVAAASSDLDSRLALQTAVFNSLAKAELDASPESRTATGDYSHAGRLDDVSLGAAARAAQRDQVFRDRLEAITTDGFMLEDQTSHDVLLYELDQRLANHRLKMEESPLSIQGNVLDDLESLPDAFPLDTVERYRDYLGRLHDIPRVLDETRAAMVQAEEDDLTEPKSLVTGLAKRCAAIVDSDPWIKPAEQIPSAAAGSHAGLAQQLRASVDGEVLPAFHAFCSFLAGEYQSHARSSESVSAMPDGQQRYANYIHMETTTDLTAADIHTVGLHEVERLNARLSEIARQAGYSDLATYRAALDADPRLTPKSSDQIVEDFKHYLAIVKPRLSEIVRDPPETLLVVEPSPAASFPDITHHIDGSDDGKTPGRILVAVSDPGHRKLISDETIAFHEGWPGHELQSSIKHRIKGLPDFRRELQYNAYAEGWAVYAEGLGEVLGLFRDPASEYGRLNTELTRALRLVADTGMHAQGWTRDQVVAYLRASGAEDEPTVQAEADRIVAWPAQGLSYKIGQMKILELRGRAQRVLGPDFDLKDFHAIVLGGGDLPLTVLEARVNQWIATAHANARHG